MLLGKTIKKIREARELTQEYMAFEMGISQSSYAKIENNQVRLDLVKISLIAKIFKLSVVEIIMYFEEPSNLQNLAASPEKTLEEVDSALAQNQIKVFHSLINQLSERINDLQKEMRILKNRK